MQVNIAMKQKMLDLYAKLTKREKFLLSSLGIFFLFIIFYLLFTYINAIFLKQDKELRLLEQQIRQTAPLIDTYLKLKAENEEIAKRYQGAVINENLKSYLEEIAKQAGISKRLNIKRYDMISFGEKFKKVPVNISFLSQNIKDVMTFLMKVNTSPQPLLINNISIRKLGRNLSVNISLEAIGERVGEAQS